MAKEILLTQGQFALIDDKDDEILSRHKWHAMRIGNTFYAARKGEGNKTIFMHRQIMNVLPALEIDHINHNGLDNRRINLRACTHQQNTQNRRTNQRQTSSQYKGVGLRSSKKKWAAFIFHNNKSISLGCYSAEIDAAKAYDRKAKELFGKFAKTNFIASPEQGHLVSI